MAKINAKTRKALQELDLSKEEREVVAKLEKKIRDRQEKAHHVLKGNCKLPVMNKEKLEKDPKAKAKARADARGVHRSRQGLAAQGGFAVDLRHGEDACRGKGTARSMDRAGEGVGCTRRFAGS